MVLPPTRKTGRAGVLIKIYRKPLKSLKTFAIRSSRRLPRVLSTARRCFPATARRCSPVTARRCCPWLRPFPRRDPSGRTLPLPLPRRPRRRKGRARRRKAGARPRRSILVREMSSPSSLPAPLASASLPLRPPSPHPRPTTASASMAAAPPPVLCSSPAAPASGQDPYRFCASCSLRGRRRRGSGRRHVRRHCPALPGVWLDPVLRRRHASSQFLLLGSQFCLLCVEANELHSISCHALDTALALH
jgi:hypothetical protein